MDRKVKNMMVRADNVRFRVYMALDMVIWRSKRAIENLIYICVYRLVCLYDLIVERLYDAREAIVYSKFVWSFGKLLQRFYARFYARFARAICISVFIIQKVWRDDD